MKSIELSSEIAVASTGPIRLGDLVTISLGIGPGAKSHTLVVDRSGDDELILRIPGSTACIVVGDKFYMTYNVEQVGMKGGRRSWQASLSRIPTQEFETYEFTFWIRGTKTVCTGRAKNEHTALYNAISELLTKTGVTPSAHKLMMDKFLHKRPGYDYQFKRL
jgi:hypothetical protein